MNDPQASTLQGHVPSVEVVIEVPRGSFIKRGSNGIVDFVSPIPCPYNYGSIPDYIGGEGDYLDAIVLGPRLPAGSRVRVQAYGSVGFSERHMYDDKLVCGNQGITRETKRKLLISFAIYARAKTVINLLKGRSGGARCEGWGSAEAALGRSIAAGEVPARPRVGF